MHGYIGNASNDPTTVQVLDDSDNWTATIVDTPLETLADTTAYLRSRLNQCSNNWPHPIAAWSGTQVAGGTLNLQCPPVWHAGYGAWIGLMGDGASFQTVHVCQSADGYSWLDTGLDQGGAGNTFSGVGVFTRGTDGTFIVAIYEVGAVTGPVTYVVTEAGYTEYVGAGPWTAPSGGHYWSGGWMVVSNVWVTWLGGATSAPQWSADGHTWAAATTWAPPAGFTIHDRAHFVATIAGNGFAAVYPAGTSVVGSLMVTLNGKDWAAEPMPAFTLSGEQVIDAAYDSFTSTFYLLSGNTTATHVWSATTLGVWTLAATVPLQAFALRANGRELLMWVSLGGAADTPGASYSAIVSSNGGVTWQGPIGPRTATAPGANFALRASGGAFMYCNATEYATSAYVGAPPVLVL